MSKTVILAINSKYIHSSLAVWQLAESISQYSRIQHSVEVIETSINQDDDEIISQIVAHKPDIIGISTYIWNASKLLNIIKNLHNQLPEAVLVLGGPEASFNAEYWIDNGANFVICGEGEESFPMLIDALEAGVSPECVPGLHWRESGKICINAEAEPPDSFIDPFTETMLAALKGKIAYIETSRGCPFRCAFCLSGDSEVRFLPLYAAKEQIRKLSRADVRIIKFVDRTFNCDTKRAYELFKYVIETGEGNHFHFEVSADLFDDVTLSLLEAAPPGMIQLEAGLQSFFKPALKASHRQANLQKAIKNIRTILSGGNIHIHLDLIAGLPYETLSDFQDSFDQAYEIGGHKLQLGFLKMLHGSALRRNEKSIIFSQAPPYEIECSPWMSASDLKALKQIEGALQSTYNKGHFLSAIKYTLSATRMRPSHFYYALGVAVQKNGMPLDVYAERVYDFCVSLRCVSKDALIDCMICDWLGMVKGTNMPYFLKIADKSQLNLAREKAEMALGRKVRRREVAILSCGKSVFVDSDDLDLVTGLYRIY